MRKSIFIFCNLLLIQTMFAIDFETLKEHTIKNAKELEILKSDEVYFCKKKLNCVGNMQKKNLVSNVIQIVNLYSGILENDKIFIGNRESLSTINYIQQG